MRFEKWIQGTLCLPVFFLKTVSPETFSWLPQAWGELGPSHLLIAQAAWDTEPVLTQSSSTVFQMGFFRRRYKEIIEAEKNRKENEDGWDWVQKNQ